ncbi:MAG TPA: Uma2 family endonuclease [Blastocatellia bacterium]|nr:Uma2 family endonuclease [Blastocatellia bacterium]
MAAELKPKLTFDEYLEIEGKAEFKSELINGWMYAMAGASPEHNQIVANIIIELGSQLKKRPCVVYPSDLPLKVEKREHGRYPDVTVVCGEPQFHKSKYLKALLNPTVLVEVLSDSTEDFDRDAKTEEYRGIPSLREYLLIAQDRCHVEHYVRQTANQWLLTEFKDLQDTIYLPSIDCRLALTEVYDKVKWPEEA